MDAPSLSPERSVELAALRRRAYGPDADIGADEAALDRLRELEALARTRASDPGENPDAPVADPLGAVAERVADAQPTADSVVVAEASPWWRRRVPVWAIVAVSVVVGIAIGAGAVSLSAPRPDATLRIAPSAGERGANWERDLSSWGLIAGSAQPYDEYDGVGVWRVGTDDGSSCILLEDEGRPVTIGCAGGGLDPILDVAVYADTEPIFDSIRRVGSVVRFSVQGSIITVWERSAQGSAAGDSSSSDAMPSAR